MALGHKAASVLLGVTAALGLAGCGEGLGECNQAALGGNNIIGMVMPYEGQRIVAERCVLCHSENSKGDRRVGAPAGLDFDVFDPNPATMARGVGNVVDWAEDMWEEIEEGAMPPEKPAGSGELSSAEKEAVRNWLACGAPAIQPDPSAPTATWDGIWNALGAQCVSCHNMTGAPSFENVLLGELGDACGSYANIVGHVSMTAECSGQQLVVPNNPGASQLYLKLKNDPAKCGSPMPLTSATGLVGTPQQAVLGLIETWINNGAPPPAGCP